MVDLSVLFNETINNINGIHTISDPNKLILTSELISTAYMSTDNIKRKEAENKLEIIQKTSISQHLTELFQIIYNINNQNSALEERIIIYTSALLRKIMNFEKFDDPLTIIQLIGLNVLCLFKENIFIKNKMKLSVALEYLINLSTLIDVKSQVILVVLNFLDTYLENQENLSKTLTKMLIIKVMIHQIFENSSITQKLFIIFQKVLFNLKTSINALLISLTTPDNNSLHNENLEILILITDIISIFFQKSLNDHEYKHHLKNFIQNQECLELFLKIFLMQIKNDGMNILTFHENDDIINAINNIKYNIIHSINILHHYIGNNEEQYALNFNEMSNSHYQVFNESLLKNIVAQFKLIFCDGKFLEENKKIIEVKNIIIFIFLIIIIKVSIISTIIK